MLLPITYGSMMLALGLAALLWGLWANTQRADGRWRFELYAFDFAAGVLLMSILLALTAGNAGSADAFTFEDVLTVAGKRNMLTATGGGVLVGIGNLMVLAGVALAGMSTALPAGAAVALLVAVAWQGLGGKAANAGLIYGAAVVALASLLANALAQRAAAVATPVKKGLHPGWKGFILATVGGLVGGAGYPVLESSRGGDIGVGAYGAAVFGAIGIFLITPLVNLYLLNLPVKGEPLSPLAYLKGTSKQHLLGIAGGALWVTGLLAILSASGGTFAGASKPLGAQAAAQTSALVGAICGVVLWKEQEVSGMARLMVLGAGALVGGAGAMVFLGA
jgi:glucose uptake protein